MPRHTLFTFPHGLALPSFVGLPEGYPFVHNHGNGTATLYTIRDGLWQEAAVVPYVGLAAASAGVAQVVGALTVTPPPPFSDNFNRSNRTLNGDNGWVNSTGTGSGGAPAAYAISGNTVTNPATGDSDPILHVRNDGTAGVADVTVTHTYPSGGGFHGGRLYVASDLGNANSIALRFDTSNTATVQRHVGLDSNAGTWFPTTTTTYNGGWASWAFATPMVIRLVYTEATSLLEVYQNGVKKLDCDMSSANFGGTGTLPALSTMPYCGLVGRAQDIFDDLVCA